MDRFENEGPADWIITVRFVVPNLIAHSDVDAQGIAEWVIEQEGLLGVVDIDSMEILTIVPRRGKEV